MLDQAYKDGAVAALRLYGVKEAGLFDMSLRDVGRGIKEMAVGRPSELLKGRALFKPGQPLHWKNVFWPSSPEVAVRPLTEDVLGLKLHAPAGSYAAGTRINEDVLKGLQQHGVKNVHTGPTWLHHLGTNVNRLLMTGLPAYQIYQAATGAGDPNEGRLTNVLSGLGNLAGGSYGFPVLGMAGGTALGLLGAELGRGLGHALGSKPDPVPEGASYPPGNVVPRHYGGAYGGVY